jgi:hypothetical protein
MAALTPGLVTSCDKFSPLIGRGETRHRFTRTCLAFLVTVTSKLVTDFALKIKGKLAVVTSCDELICGNSSQVENKLVQSCRVETRHRLRRKRNH